MCIRDSSTVGYSSNSWASLLDVFSIATASVSGLLPLFSYATDRLLWPTTLTHHVDVVGVNCSLYLLFCYVSTIYRFVIINISKMSCFVMLFCSYGASECYWSEKQRQLAEWAFDRWKLYQYTSLRVSTKYHFDYDSIVT